MACFETDYTNKPPNKNCKNYINKGDKIKSTKKFQIYYTDDYAKIRTEVVQKILEEECQSFEIIQDMKKVFLTTKGTSKLAIFHLDKYIGYNYRDLVYYLNDQGMVLC